MDRREFLATGASAAIVTTSKLDRTVSAALLPQDEIRAAFPRVASERFVNAAAGTPLGTFAERGIQRYIDFQKLGSAQGRGDYVNDMLSNIRGAFGGLIGARESEIALVHCTKAGEQVVIDGLDPMRNGGNIVTNDFHFSGSLHNLTGLQRAGVDVRIVKSRDWNVSAEDMVSVIDDETKLVAITLVSNVNGRVEPVRELADAAHAHGAYVYADIIQAAGIFPLDVRELGIDFAAANGYKWLYGVHGSGFLYVRDELQGTVLADRLFPGNTRSNYAPWVDQPDVGQSDFTYQPRSNARRYEPGHHSYLGYCAVYEGLRFIERVGVDNALAHSVRMNKTINARLDPDQYVCISPDVDRSPIITFASKQPQVLERKLRNANVVISRIGNGRFRISPAVYNTDDDIDALVDALNASP